MNFQLFIARRYLFSRKTHHAINIISLIAVLGVAVTTMALLCTLSVFNGFQSLVAGMFTHFDPEIKVSPIHGGTIDLTSRQYRSLLSNPKVAVCTPVMEGQALIVMPDRQVPVRLKGVDDNFLRQSGIQDILYGDGTPILSSDVLEYEIMGIQVAGRLGLGVSFADPLQVYAPKRGERVNMANPLSSFNHDELQSSGLVFCVHQGKYDAEYVLCSLPFAQRIFDAEGKASAIEIKLAPGATRDDIAAIVGDKYKVQDRYEQQEDVFRIMQVEKFISYTFLCFILLVACLNMVGSLSMLMIEKKHDAQTLLSLGASASQIRGIFMNEGRLIILAGAVAGTLLGVLLCWIQQEYGLIRMGQAEGSFIIDAYPVVVQPVDVLIVLSTVLFVGFASVWYAVRRF